MTEEQELYEIRQMPEAPASLNVRFASQMGFECLLTVRCFDEQEGGKTLLAKLATVEEALHKKGCKPIFGKNATAPAQGEAEAKPKGWCSIHNLQMFRHEKDGRAWYSHPIDGTDPVQWCRGK